MGVPTSEVCYTSAMPRREDHKVHKDMWGHWGGKKVNGVTCQTPLKTDINNVMLLYLKL